jgi:hypothetical protein
MMHWCTNKIFFNIYGSLKIKWILRTFSFRHDFFQVSQKRSGGIPEQYTYGKVFCYHSAQGGGLKEIFTPQLGYPRFQDI